MSFTPGPGTTYLLTSTQPIPSGTANGVLYLNGSKVVTSGTDLVFNATGLGIGTSSPAYKLDVVGSSRIGGDSPYLYIQDTVNPASDVGVYFGAPSAATYAGILTNFASDQLLFRHNSATRMILDSSGNLGLGVTPSAWNASYKALDISSAAAITASGSDILSVSNAFLNVAAGWIYKATGAASFSRQTGGAHQWFNAPSGTAGNAISFTQAMTLDASGNLIVGGTSPFLSSAGRGNISINGASSSVLAMGVGAVSATYLYCSSNDADLWNPLNGFIRFGTNNTERARITSGGSLVVGTAALATTATDGFLYVPTCAGTPTGTPTTQTGTAPIVVDTTNNKLYFYSGGQWRDAGP